MNLVIEVEICYNMLEKQLASLEKVLVEMGTAFKKALFVFIGFIVVLGGVLVGVICELLSIRVAPRNCPDGRFSGSAVGGPWCMYPEFSQCRVNFLVSTCLGK